MGRIRGDWIMKLAGLSASLLIASGAPALEIDWVHVGDEGNACDAGRKCEGAVPHAFRMGRLEVTNQQYVELLNAVAKTDTFDVYVTAMSTSYAGGITRSGTSGSYVYAPRPGRDHWPVLYVSYWSAARFANWLHNGQPSGDQDNTTTEDGAYTLTASAISNNTVTRNSGAKVFLPSNDEWYKAAYYDGTSYYFEYPYGTDNFPTCDYPSALADHASCTHDGGTPPEEVGSYTGSPSPYGTYDQGGNAFEWNERTIGSSGQFRAYRGGAYDEAAGELTAWTFFGTTPSYTGYDIGFRVAGLAEQTQSVPVLDSLALLMLWGLLGASAHSMLREATG